MVLLILFLQEKKFYILQLLHLLLQYYTRSTCSTSASTSYY
jgi:hypothetical protein